MTIYSYDQLEQAQKYIYELNTLLTEITTSNTANKYKSFSKHVISQIYFCENQIRNFLSNTQDSAVN